MEDIIATVSSRYLSHTGTLELTPTTLHFRWQGRSSSGETSIPLSELRPQVQHWTGRPDGAMTYLFASTGILALAAIVYYSAIHPLAPLLAPALLIVGILLAVRAAFRIRIETFTIFMQKDGQRFASVVHRNCKPQELEQFEAAFETQCQAARFRNE